MRKTWSQGLRNLAITASWTPSERCLRIEMVNLQPTRVRSVVRVRMFPLGLLLWLLVLWLTRPGRSRHWLVWLWMAAGDSSVNVHRRHSSSVAVETSAPPAFGCGNNFPQYYLYACRTARWKAAGRWRLFPARYVTLLGGRNVYGL